MAICGEIHEVISQARQSERLLRGLTFLKDFFQARDQDLQARAFQLEAGQKFDVPILGEDVFASFQAYAPRAREKAVYEAHKEFTDLQLLARGEEIIEVCPLPHLSTAPAYDAHENVFFPLSKAPGSRLLMHAGILAVLFPSDAHAPGLRINEDAGGVNLKVVVKVRNALS